jgi:hypothetical protein
MDEWIFNFLSISTGFLSYRLVWLYTFCWLHFALTQFNFLQIVQIPEF